MSKLYIVISDRSLTFLSGGKVQAHLSDIQFRILAALRQLDWRRRALAAIAFNLAESRGERKGKGEQLTASQRASLFRSVRRLQQQGLIEFDGEYFSSTDRGEAIVDAVYDDTIGKRDSYRTCARTMGISRDEFIRLTRCGGETQEVNDSTEAKS